MKAAILVQDTPIFLILLQIVKKLKQLAKKLINTKIIHQQKQNNQHRRKILTITKIAQVMVKNKKLIILISLLQAE